MIALGVGMCLPWFKDNQGQVPGLALKMLLPIDLGRGRKV